MLYLEHVRERKWLVAFVITPLLLGIVEPQACYLPNDPCLSTQYLPHSFPWHAWAPTPLRCRRWRAHAAHNSTQPYMPQPNLGSALGMWRRRPPAQCMGQFDAGSRNSSHSLQRLISFSLWANLQSSSPPPSQCTRLECFMKKVLPCLVVAFPHCSSSMIFSTPHVVSVFGHWSTRDISICRRGWVGVPFGYKKRASRVGVTDSHALAWPLDMGRRAPTV